MKNIYPCFHISTYNLEMILIGIMLLDIPRSFVFHNTETRYIIMLLDFLDIQ